jgi:hypothetical protein
MRDAPPADPDRLALEEERDFCLLSLRDLEAERDAGDIDAGDYVALRSSYVARAAAALRALGTDEGADAHPDPLAALQVEVDAEAIPPRNGDQAVGSLSARDSGTEESSRVTSRADGSVPGRDSAESPGDDTPARPPRFSRRRALVAGVGVAVIAGAAAWSVVASSATRLPGQEITGQSLGTEAVARSLQQAQQAADRGNGVSAMKDYEKILKADPTQPEALTGAGWLLAQTQQPPLLRQGLAMLASAEQADATYVPAHLYRGIALLSEDDYSDAIPELRWYLGHDPDPQLAGRIRQALQQAETKAAAASKAGG